MSPCVGPSSVTHWRKAENLKACSCVVAPDCRGCLARSGVAPAASLLAQQLFCTTIFSIWGNYSGTLWLNSVNGLSAFFTRACSCVCIIKNKKNKEGAASCTSLAGFLPTSLHVLARLFFTAQRGGRIMSHVLLVPLVYKNRRGCV